MNNNKDQMKDREYIRSLFDEDGIKAPESLSEENIFSMLPDRVPAADDSQRDISGPVSKPDAASEPASDADFTGNDGQQRTPARRRLTAKRLIAAAACLLAVVIGGTGIYRSLTAPPDVSTANGELYTFRDSSEIKNLISSLDTAPQWYSTGDGLELLEDADVAAEGESSDSATQSLPDTGVRNFSAKSSGSSAEASHSDTYLQVEEVDEADIVKTDGKYIYYVTDSREVVILRADRGKTEKVSSIGSEGVENYIHDIYLKGDTLVTVGTFYEDDDEYTGIVTYDISDRSDPKLITTFSQTGYIVSSRMVGDYVYLVTSDYVYKDGRILPKCTVDGEVREMAATDICCVPEPSQPSYIVLGAMDVTSGKHAKCKSAAVFGASDDIYCNDHNLYAVTGEWDKKDYTVNTRIVRARLDGLKIRFDATAKVRGYIDDQFSMDERGGYFRIATTSTRDDIEVNNLFVLDEDLKETGKLTGFARNESIKAVRYFGDKAYVITYEQIDPLFVIDLKDPAKPSIDGEVKIDGFSTLLIPCGEGRLLGIGHATGDNGYGGEYAAGLKLVLFDISDPSKPEVIDSKEFKDMESPAQDTHKALTVNSAEGWYAVPYGIYSYDNEPDAEVIDEDVPAEDAGESEDAGDLEDAETDEDTTAEEYIEPGYESGVLVFGAGDGLEVYDQHKLGQRYLQRSVYIGDYIYALDSEGNVDSFRFTK